MMGLWQTFHAAAPTCRASSASGSSPCCTVPAAGGQWCRRRAEAAAASSPPAHPTGPHRWGCLRSACSPSSTSRCGCEALTSSTALRCERFSDSPLACRCANVSLAALPSGPRHQAVRPVLRQLPPSGGGVGGLAAARGGGRGSGGLSRAATQPPAGGEAEAGEDWRGGGEGERLSECGYTPFICAEA